MTIAIARIALLRRLVAMAVVAGSLWPLPASAIDPKLIDTTDVLLDEVGESIKHEDVEIEVLVPKDLCTLPPLPPLPPLWGFMPAARTHQELAARIACNAFDKAALQTHGNLKVRLIERDANGPSAQADA